MSQQTFGSPDAPAAEIEEGTLFRPRFTEEGLIPAIVRDQASGAILMFGWMNAETLRLTLETRTAHFWSRSRGRIWKKGEESGNLLRVLSVTTDCDQDVVALDVTIEGAGLACHTGRVSCFYRTVGLDAGGHAILTGTRPAKR